MVFVIEEKPHDVYKRDGDDLIVEVKVPLVDALSGPTPPATFTRSLTTLDGRTIRYDLPYPSAKLGGKPLMPGQIIRVSGEVSTGMCPSAAALFLGRETDVVLPRFSNLRECPFRARTQPKRRATSWSKSTSRSQLASLHHKLKGSRECLDRLKAPETRDFIVYACPATRIRASMTGKRI